MIYRMGDIVRLEKIHHAMNSDLKQLHLKEGVVVVVAPERDEYSVEFFKGPRGSWWIKAKYLTLVNAKCNAKCDSCQGENVYYTGHGVYQEQDASRNMPEVDADIVVCRDCGNTFYY